MSNVSDKGCRQNQNRDLFYFQLFFSENHVINEKVWKNVVDPDRPQMRNMVHAL
jgi:hypothetical protein